MTVRVLCITGEYPPMRGGIADYARRLVDSLQEHDVETNVITSSQAALCGDERVHATVETWGRNLAGTVRRAVEDLSPDVIHIQYQTGAFQMRPSINLLPFHLGVVRRPVPIVTTYHDLLVPYLFPRAGRLRRWANRLLARGSDAIILTNERDRSVVQRYRPVRQRVHMIPIGSNIELVGDVDRSRELERLGADSGRFVVAFFGFLTADKGIDDLLDALERPDMEGIELLVLSGELATTDRANRRFRERIVKRLNQSPVPVRITDFLPEEEIAKGLAAADLIALPYKSGASLRSGTLIAALQSGTPVVTTDPLPGDSLAPFSAGESMWLVPATEPDFLHGAIRLLRSETALANGLAARAREAARQFSFTEIARQHAQLYRRLAAR